MTNISRSMITTEVQKKLRTFYYKYFSIPCPDVSIGRGGTEKEEVILMLSPDEEKRMEIKRPPLMMLVCKRFYGSGFLNFIGVNNYPDIPRSSLAEMIAEGSQEYGYGRCGGVEYLLVKGFLGIGEELMIAVGHSSSLYGFSFDTGRIGMMR